MIRGGNLNPNIFGYLLAALIIFALVKLGRKQK
jgi:hypothetical protein